MKVKLLAATFLVVACIAPAAEMQTASPVAITSVSPKVVDLGRQIRVLIKGPSEKGRKVEFRIFPLDVTSLLKSAAPTGLVRYQETVTDNEVDKEAKKGDYDPRDGIIEVRVQTDLSWAPRRYGLVVWEPDDKGHDDFARLRSMQRISVRRVGEFAESMLPLLNEEYERLAKYTTMLKVIQARADQRTGWESAAATAWACPEECITEHSGFVFHSASLKRQKVTPTTGLALWAIKDAADELDVELLDLYSSASELPDDQEKVYLDKLQGLRGELATLKKDPFKQ